MPALNLSQLVDLALGSPEVGAVNFNILHTLLHAMIKQLNISDIKANVNDADRDFLSGSEKMRLLSSMIGDKDSGKEDSEDTQSEKSSSELRKHRPPYHQLESRVAQLAEQLEQLNALPSTSELFQKIKATGDTGRPTPIADLWQSMQISKRVDANESGVSKLMSMVEDLMREMDILKDEYKKVDDLMKEMQKLKAENNSLKNRLDNLGLDDLRNQLNNLESLTKDLNDKFGQLPDYSFLPSAEEFAGFVTWPQLEDALNGVRLGFQELMTPLQQVAGPKSPSQTTIPSRPNSSRTSTRLSTASSGPTNEILEILERLGKIVGQHEELEHRIEDLENQMKDKVGLEAFQDALGKINLDVPEDLLMQLEQLKKDMEELQRELQMNRDKMKPLGSAFSSAMHTYSTPSKKGSALLPPLARKQSSHSEPGGTEPGATDETFGLHVSPGGVDVDPTPADGRDVTYLKKRVIFIEEQLRVLQGVVLEDSAYFSDLGDLNSNLSEMDRKYSEISMQLSQISGSSSQFSPITVVLNSQQAPLPEPSVSGHAMLEEQASTEPPSGGQSGAVADVTNPSSQAAQLGPLAFNVPGQPTPQPAGPKIKTGLPGSLEPIVSCAPIGKSVGGGKDKKPLPQIKKENGKQQKKNHPKDLHSSQEILAIFDRQHVIEDDLKNVEGDMVHNSQDIRETNFKMRELGTVLNTQLKDVKERLFLMNHDFRKMAKGIEFAIIRTQMSGASAMDNDAVMRAQKAILKLQGDVGQLHSTTEDIINENNTRTTQIESLFQYSDKLQEVKADKEYVAMEVDVKADKRHLESKVNHSLFESTNAEVNRMVKEILDKLSGHELGWKDAMGKLSGEVECKLDRLELESLKEWLESRLKALNQKIKQTSEWSDDDAAGLRKQLLQRFHCISCDRPVDMMAAGPVPSIPMNSGMPPTRSPRPYTTFELDQIRQHAKSLQGVGDLYGGFPYVLRHSGFGVMGKNTMNFERAMAERSMARMRKTDLKTFMFQQYHREEFGVEEEEILPTQEMADLYATDRPCGGTHTLTYPHKRATKLSHLSNLFNDEPAVAPPAPVAFKNRSEQDLLGVDGHIYKGRMRKRGGHPAVANFSQNTSGVQRRMSPPPSPRLPERPTTSTVVVKPPTTPVPLNSRPRPTSAVPRPTSGGSATRLGSGRLTMRPQSARGVCRTGPASGSESPSPPPEEPHEFLPIEQTSEQPLSEPVEVPMETPADEGQN